MLVEKLTLFQTAIEDLFRPEELHKKKAVLKIALFEKITIDFHVRITAL